MEIDPLPAVALTAIGMAISFLQTDWPVVPGWLVMTGSALTAKIVELLNVVLQFVAFTVMFVTVRGCPLLEMVTNTVKLPVPLAVEVMLVI